MLRDKEGKFVQLVLYDDGALLCKIFPATLKGEASRWFPKLPPRSFNSWGDLSTKFMEKFRHNWTKPKAVNHLFNITQQENEPVRKYVARFWQAVLEIDNPEDGVH